MGKFSGVLLASDFDDTLYNSSDEVSPENLLALDYFTREGGRFTVATGRAHRTFAPYAHLAPINAPVILSNGAILYDFVLDKTVLELPLPPRAAADLSALCAQFPDLGVETYHGDDVYIHRPNAFTQHHVARVNTSWTPMDLSDMPTPWSKAVIQAAYSTLLAAQAYMQAHYPDQYEVIFSNQALLECTSKGSTKGGMVLRVAELLGIQRAHIYCVGDNQNDLPMLEISAIPFAPSNCAQAVKDWGPHLLRSCDEHCIAQLIDILDKRY